MADAFATITSAITFGFSSLTSGVNFITSNAILLASVGIGLAFKLLHGTKKAVRR